MEMVERVARAIAERNGDNYDEIPKHKPDWTQSGGMFAGRFRDVNEPYQTDYEDMAEAAIEAMREPTEAMLKAGDVPGWDDSVTVGHSAEVWEAMISAALSTPPEADNEQQ